MANTVYSTPTLSPALLKADIEQPISRLPNDGENNFYMRLSIQLIETYCHKTFPYSIVATRYTISDPHAPLAAVEDYPINEQLKVAGSDGATIEVLFDDRYIWSDSPWPSLVDVSYLGGLPSLIYSATVKQANVLRTRRDVAPENIDFKLGPFDKNFRPEFRGGLLAPDIKQQVTPFKDYAGSF